MTRSGLARPGPLLAFLLFTALLFAATGFAAGRAPPTT